MHLSQPAVSQRLSRLQEHIGATLFVRKDGVMRATAAGERLVTASRAVSRELDSALSDIRNIVARREKHLRITTQCYTCYRWLPYVIRDMRELYPDLTVDVVPEATDKPHAALADDRIDLAIVSDPDGTADFEQYPLFEDELYAVMSTGHPYAQRKFLNPAQFADQTLVLYTGDRHPVLDEILHPAGITPAGLIEVRITEAIVELARSGHGIAVLAGWAIDDFADRSGLAAVRITRRGFRRQWLAVVADNCEQDQADAFIRCVRHAGKAMQKRAWRKRLQQKGSRRVA